MSGPAADGARSTPHATVADMPITYTLYPDQGLVVTTFSGVVADPEFVDFYRSLYSDPAYSAGVGELADLRQVTSFRITADALHEVKTLGEERYAGTDTTFRTAIVAPSDLSFGIARIYDALVAGGPEEVAVFRGLGEALEWLALDEIPDDLDAGPTDGRRSR